MQDQRSSPHPHRDNIRFLTIKLLLELLCCFIKKKKKKTRLIPRDKLDLLRDFSVANPILVSKCVILINHNIS